MASKVQPKSKPASTVKAKAATKPAPKKAVAKKPVPKTTKDGKPMPPNAGLGRPPGSPNKATAKAKEAIAMLADGMTHELQGWLRMAAYGTGTAWVEWERPLSWDEEADGPYPPGAKVLAKGKLVLVPFVDSDGVQLSSVSLADVMSGLLPPGTIIDWLVKPDPGGATDTMLRALEYHIPKLGRMEHVGDKGKALVPATITIVGVRAPKRSE